MGGEGTALTPPSFSFRTSTTRATQRPLHCRQRCVHCVVLCGVVLDVLCCVVLCCVLCYAVLCCAFSPNLPSHPRLPTVYQSQYAPSVAVRVCLHGDRVTISSAAGRHLLYNISNHEIRFACVMCALCIV